MPLDPENLTPAASLNRVHIVDLPGVAVREDVKGKSAFDLLGLHVVQAGIREAKAVLALTEEELEDAPGLPRALAGRLISNNEPARSAAKRICKTYGQNLGYLVATLKRGDAVNRAAREEWDASYWQYWSGINTVWLGGGLASGPLGTALAKEAGVVLLASGVDDCKVRAAHHGAYLPLIGAGRSMVDEASAALVFDFGSTSIKSGLAGYENGCLAKLSVFPSRPAFGPEVDLTEAMASLMAESFANLTGRGSALAPVIIASLANYIRDNHPFSYMLSSYSRLHAGVTNLGDWLSSRVSGLAGRPLEVRLMHDGTAAAMTYAGATRTAVIMMGTALGSGFPSLVRPAVPLSPEFYMIESP